MRGSKRFAWTIATPAILGLIAVSIVPIVWMAFSAFQKFSPNPKVAPKFNGLDNLWALFEDPQFVNSIGLTAFIGVILFVIQLTLGFAIAWALYHIRRGRSIVVSLILIPTAIAPLIAGLAWWMLFNTKFGAVNSILGIFGIDCSDAVGPCCHHCRLGLARHSIYSCNSTWWPNDDSAGCA